tara:strand:- start:2014 stop:2745 length:732 start_codon:yes stop_codon:yes gene_type:complete
MSQKTEIIEKLRDDEHYYGDFGKQFLSNSDISALLTNPLDFKKPSKPIPAFLVGGYFHTCILEPDKLKKYKVINASTRNTKIYKEISGGELCLLQHEVDQIEVMRDKMLNNEIISKLITGNVEYEVPGIVEIENNFWKGKADIVNHDEKLIIDLKTTNDIQAFRYSAKRYNYDSQAYIYNKLFNYDFLFIVVDKNTHQLGLFDVSDKFYQTGLDKVQKATDVYELFYKTENFKPENYFINQTL